MSRFFFIGVGGTGAKVAEAFVHLCAAGLGPEQADILLIDVDEDNGNLHRTRACLEQYAKLCRWPWAGQKTAHLFRTELRLHLLVQKLDVVNRGGLQTEAVTPPSLRPLLNLFFDESEQTSDCAEGFFARPNLGSLVMGSHLRQMFETSSSRLNSAPVFMEKLRAAIDNLPAGSKVPLAVAGSVFGGTGASVFPVVVSALRGALGEGTVEKEKKQQAEDRLAKVHVAALMLLPYFMPAGTEEDGSRPVDPSRYLLDTSNALKHYGRTDALEGFGASYLVGSDQAGRNVIKYQAGSKGQANAPMIEEVVGALGLLHLIQNAAGERRVYVYRPAGEKTHLGWEDLPWPRVAGKDGATLIRTLLHVGAFYLHEGAANQPLGQGICASMEQWKGAAGGEEAALHPWFKPVLHKWATHFDKYRDADLSEWDRLADGRGLPEGASTHQASGPAWEYFGRLLCWAHFALEGFRDRDLDLLHWDSRADGLPYWEAMSAVKPAAVEVDAAHDLDNALVRVLRTAIAGTGMLLAGSQEARRTFASRASQGPKGQVRGFDTALPEAWKRKDLNGIREEYARTHAETPR